MGLDVCKICDSEKSGMNHQFPKDHDTALQQTVGDIQNGFCGAEDPGTQDPNLTFETQMLCSQPVLYVNHKQLVQKVCIYVVGDDLGDVGFDFEDLRIRKEIDGPCRQNFPRWIPKHPTGISILGQYRIILSADTASEVRQMLSQKRR